MGVLLWLPTHVFEDFDYGADSDDGAAQKDDRSDERVVFAFLSKVLQEGWGLRRRRRWRPRWPKPLRQRRTAFEDDGLREIERRHLHASSHRGNIDDTGRLNLKREIHEIFTARERQPRRHRAIRWEILPAK